MGGKVARQINICDKNGTVLPDASVAPGDVVAATMYANQVYTGVGGDKFGIHWSFEDVCVICQRAKLERRTEVCAFQGIDYDFAQDYTIAAPMDFDPMMTANI
jgi:phage terminase large subunit